MKRAERRKKRWNKIMNRRKLARNKVRLKPFSFDGIFARSSIGKFKRRLEHFRQRPQYIRQLDSTEEQLKEYR